MAATTAERGARPTRARPSLALFVEDITRDHHDALRYRERDRLVLRVLYAHLAGFLVLLALVGPLVALPATAAGPFGWRVLSWTEVAGAGLLAALAALLPPLLHGRLRQHYGWRVLTTVALATFSYLFIFASGGSIEMHFHFFIVLALVAMWADWRLGWIVLGLTLVHHLVLGAYAPGWVYQHEAAPASVLAHGVPLLLTVAVLTVLAEQQRRTVGELRASEQGLERKVAERTRELEEARREMEAFSYTVAHDLRAPVRGVTELARYTLEDLPEERDAGARENLGSIVRSGERMAGMIEDILRFARTPRGEVQRERVDLSAMAREILDELRRQDPARGVEATVAPGVVASGDPDLLRVALDNLLRNAWKFTRETSPARIRVDGAQADGRVTLRVADNGVGFEPRQALRLFQPFQRLHSGFEGTGVGLSTVQKIAQRHGGSVRAEGAPGAGATFYLELPAA
ncbi:MAG TPA: ATP-binding protein [Candidatus Thermoplasmatota archaeon]|nr:ATP-binding protein [Candidatus Thermoplasmatota archaeon]